MLKAKDFRAYGREALRGRWLKAGAAGLVAGLLGASLSVSNLVTSYSGAVTGSGSSSDVSAVGATGASYIPASLLAAILGVLLIVLVWAIVIFIIGGAATLGYAKYNLNLVDDKDPKLKDVVSQFHRIGNGFGMQFFRGLYTFLWSLLLLIPGIVASYSYYMAPFILVEHPEMTGREAIRESKELMKGNRWRLFCLEFSFLGWELLAIGIMWIVMMVTIFPMAASTMIDTEAFIWRVFIVAFIDIIVFIVLMELILSPYIIASVTAFYREISEGRYSSSQIDGVAEESPYEERTEDTYIEAQPAADSWENENKEE